MVEESLIMKRRLFPSAVILLFCVSWFHFQGISNVYSEIDINNGIQPLLELSGQPLHVLVPESTRPLIFVKEMEQFLQKLEGRPPDWTQLHHFDITEQSERLFRLNRHRDEARTAQNSLLQQPIAFLWAGFLRQYLPEYQGFSLALGPVLTPTSWGIIRFKPIGLPDYLVAIPSPAFRKQLLTRQQQGEQIEIMVLFIGTLTPNESLIYAFSHDGHEDGMILPVVSIQNIMYILKPS